MAENNNISQLDTTDEMVAEGRQYTGKMPDDMSKWMAKTIIAIDYFSLKTGQIIAWLAVPVFASMFYEVVARHFFIAPTIWAYDISRMFAGAFFMLGAAYALSKGVHIRADFIYRNWSDKKQAIVDGCLYLLFYFPGLLIVFIASIDYAQLAWQRGERGMDTAWMPMMGPIKTVLAVGVFFLLVQGISETLKCFYAIKKNKWP